MHSDKIMDEIEDLMGKVDHCRFENKEAVRGFIKNLTLLTYDYKMMGKLYDYYSNTVEYYKQNQVQLKNVEEIVTQIIGFCAEFPDVKANVEHIIVYPVEEGFYKIFRRLRFSGTNLGYSQYGVPTGRSLEDKCLNLTMMHLKKFEDGWKIIFEINCDSEGWIREVQSSAMNTRAII